MRAIIAGGGTGGHVIPALAIAHELRERYAAAVMFIGTARGIENRLVPAAGYELRLVRVGALKQVSLLTRLQTVFALPRAIFDSARMIGEFRPEVMIGVGGYASGPAMLAGALSSVPLVAFEPNYVPGFANRLVAPMVAAAAVQFADTGRFFRNCRVTGVPVRRAFFDVQPRAAGRPTLLIFGGSQGAHALNQAMLEAIAALREAIPDLHVIHQTGERDYNEARAAYLRADAATELYPFIEDMPQAFARADLLLCRSGASTVAEITAAGKPAICVPFPKAADDHQRRNAEALVAAGAAVMVPESELTPARLVETIIALLRDRQRLAAMGAAARALAHPDAAREIAAMAARLAGHSGGPPFRPVLAKGGAVQQEAPTSQAKGTSVA
jgi:UDP-N-acetylglucosamine--N-acetylmuramyl-(pentapeptide) pyrophosphoryl-undecaprenol N-acetylglucosamine transferase